MASIFLYTGKNRSGKSLQASKRVNAMWLRGWKIATNDYSFRPRRPLLHFLCWWFKSPEVVYFRDLAETYGYTHCVIYIDEAPKILSANAWDSIPLFFKERLREHAKHGLVLIMTATSIDRLLIDVRGLVHKWFYCKSWLRWWPAEHWPCWFFFYSVYSLDSMLSCIYMEAQVMEFSPPKLKFFSFRLSFPWWRSRYGTHNILTTDFLKSSYVSNYDKELVYKIENNN